MTLKDLLKRVDLDENIDKMIIFSDGKGWCNIDVEIYENTIMIVPDKELIFSSDK